jgi:hypothetical protein
MTKLARRFVSPSVLALVAAIATGASVAAPEQSAPQGEDPPGADNGVAAPPKPHDGVIPPPDIGDEDIQTEVPNPDAGHEEEVIPPPDLPGEVPGSAPH